MATISETFRKEFSDKLHVVKVANEKQQNAIISLKYQLSLKDMQNDIQGD